MRIDRKKLRGKPLDEDCKRANRTTLDNDDSRIFCYGLYTEMSDWEIQDKCKKCGAFVYNAETLESEVHHEHNGN